MNRKENDWEKILKIHTSGRDDSRSDNYRYPYEPTPYCVLERLATSGLLGKKNTLLDYGCGKGRVDFFLSTQTGCKTIGIEYDDRIYEKALKNQEQCVNANKITFLLENAETHVVEAQADRFYFFNPFSVEILKSVLQRVKDSYYDCPRECLFFFYFPSDDYVSYLMTVEELEFYDEIDCSDLFSENANREKILIFSM